MQWIVIFWIKRARKNRKQRGFLLGLVSKKVVGCEEIVLKKRIIITKADRNKPPQE